MGAVDFTQFVEQAPRTRKPLTAKAAYSKATKDALYYSGHDPYNGTISTTAGFAVVVREPVTMRQANRMIQQYQDHEQNRYEWDDYRRDLELARDPQWRHVKPRKPRKRIENPFGGFEIEKWGACAAIPIKRSSESGRGWLFYGLAAS